MDEIRNHPKTDPTYEIQGPLALIAAGLDIHEGDRKKRKQALLEWAEGDVSKRFRQYADLHRDELPKDLEDEVALRALLEEIKTEEIKTIH